MKKTKRKIKPPDSRLELFGIFKGENLVETLMKMRRDERKRGAR